LAEVLRSRFPDVDCIIVIGYGNLDKAEAAIALGAIEYLEKLVDLESLRADLRRLGPK
jgi:ActR/RegA family two-component response regulator